jgi:hypothetical protein
MPKARTPTKPPAVGTRSTPPRESKRKRINANGELETPTTRAKRKRKAAQQKANAPAKPVKALTKALNPDPVQIIAKAHKRRVVPPPGKERKEQSAPKKANVKGRWDAPEEIDDSTFSGDEVDEEKGESDDDKEDDNNMEPHADLSDDDDSMDRMDQFVRDVEKTATEASQRRAEEELNRRAQEGAKDPPNDNDSTPMAKKLSSTHHVERDVCDDDELNAPPREEKHVRNRIVISKQAEKNSSRLKNFVILGQQHQKGRKGPSSSITSWSVCGGQMCGEMQRRQSHLYRRHGIATIPKS